MTERLEAYSSHELICGNSTNDSFVTHEPTDVGPYLSEASAAPRTQSVWQSEGLYREAHDRASSAVRWQSLTSWAGVSEPSVAIDNIAPHREGGAGGGQSSPPQQTPLTAQPATSRAACRTH